MLLRPAMSPLENQIYDSLLTYHHDLSYGTLPFTSSVRLIVYSESTKDAVGIWNPERSEELADFLLQSGAKGVFFYPGAHDELEPRRRSKDVVVVPPVVSESSDVILDSDGVCRQVALAKLEDGAWKPTSALRVLACLDQVPLDQIEFRPSEILVGSRSILTDAHYRLFVRFRRSEEALTSRTVTTSSDWEQMTPYSLESLFHPDFRASYGKRMKGAVVLVGAGFKEATDSVATPVSPLNSFKVDGCAVETMLSGKTLRPLDTLETFAMVTALTLLCFGFFSRQPTPGILVLWAIFLAGWYWLVQSTFALGLYLEYTPPLLASSFVAIWLALSRSSETSQALRRFGGAGAYEAAQRGDESVFEEVREKTATIVFTNVLSYLKELERHGSPHQFFARRQEYAQFLSDVFRKHGGVILDFQGDFQMVGFNVELRSDDDDHTVHAVEACREFLARLTEVTNRWWEADDTEIGSAHCGICTGPVACGHVGSRRHDGGRIAQAAIGDTSNVAARLLGAAMKMGEPILLAMTTVEASGGKLLVEELEPIALKGKTQAVRIARPTAESSS